MNSLKTIRLVSLALILGSLPLMLWGQESTKKPNAIKLEGPQVGDPGKQVVITVGNLPTVDITKPLSESLAFLKDLQFKLDNPEGETVNLQGDLRFDFINQNWRMNLSFTPGKAGVYVIVFVQRSELDIATHRVTVGKVAEPTEPTDPTDPPLPPISKKVTRVTYVYEKDDNDIPPTVSAGLQRLNSNSSVIATVFEDDTVDGTDETPSQYKAALEAARKVGLPALVAQAGDTVVKIVKNPQTEQHVLEAVQ